MIEFIKKNTGLSILFIISMLISFSYIFTENMPELFPHAGSLFVFFFQLSVAYIASLIFYIIVSYIPSQEAKRRYQNIALRQIRMPLYEHVQLFVYIYKACIDKKPKKTFLHVRDLFDDDYFRAIELFDTTEIAPVISKKTWVEYISKECSKFAYALDKVTGKYSYYLDEEIIDSLEKLRQSNFMRAYLEEGSNLRRHVDGYWTHEDNFIELCMNKQIKYKFTSTGDADIVRVHIGCLLKCIDLFNVHNSDKPITFNNVLWQENISPIYGSGRKK